VPNHLDPSMLPVQKLNSKVLQFQGKWFQQFPWLHWDGHRLLCFYCSSIDGENLSTVKKADPEFFNMGFKNWRKATEKYTIHPSSHEQAVEAYKQRRLTPIITGFDSQKRNDQKMSKNALEIVFSTIMYLARKGIALRLCEAMKRNQGISSNFYVYEPLIMVISKCGFGGLKKTTGNPTASVMIFK